MSKLVQARFVTGPDEKLKTQDVYEIGNNILTEQMNAGGTRGEIASAIAEGFQIASSQFPEEFAAVKNKVDEVLGKLLDRVNNLLAKLPFDLTSVFPNGLFNITLEDIQDAGLGLFWNYLGQKLNIHPQHLNMLQDAFDVVGNERSNPNNQNFNNTPENWVDLGAEILVYSGIIDGMIAAQIKPPVIEIMNNLSNDDVRRRVSEKVLPRAVNPDQLPGPRPETAIPNVDTLGGNDNEGLLYTPRVVISDDFDLDTSRRIDGNPWEGRQRIENDNSDRPNWTIPPIERYIQAFDDKSDTEITTNPRQEIDLVPGVRDNSPDPNDRPPANQSDVDLEFVEQLLDYTTPGRVVSRYPGMMGTILYFFKFPEGEYDLQEEYEKLIRIMNIIKPNWDKTIRNGEDIGLLLHFSKASSDASYLLTTYSDSEYVADVMIARSYLYNDIISLLKSQYPMAAV